MTNYMGDRDDLNSVMPSRVIATDRNEHDACQAGTPGCCVDHDRDNGSCEGW